MYLPRRSTGRRQDGTASALPLLHQPIGFTLVELMSNTCRYNQRAIESSLNMWKFNHDTEQFMTGNCLPGDGEAFIDIKGSIPGEPDRTLAPYQKRGFDCPGNGVGKGETGGCDYVTDGIAVACLTDNQIGLKADGAPFLHDKPQSVNWNHSGDREVEKKMTPLGNTFTDISEGMIGLIQAYYDKYGRYPRSFGDYIFTDIGLNPDSTGSASSLKPATSSS